MFGSLAFKTPLAIWITSFLEITAPDNLIPMTTSFIFCNKSSLTRLGLSRLLKIGGSKLLSEYWTYELYIDIRQTMLWVIWLEVIKYNLHSVPLSTRGIHNIPFIISNVSNLAIYSFWMFVFKLPIYYSTLAWGLLK